ncbi:MAG: DUF1574 domain-containing protein [Flavobacteriales bacterium]|nr:DUF1574 domain-containing protein [Flavobacteriales bacterium]
MQRFINKIIFISLPILILLFTVNYFGDAARIFDTEYEKKMAEILMNGSYVTNISNYDERVFQKELINSLNNAPEVLVLGSSRTMLINSEYFPNQPFFNNSVSGASIEDIIALYQIYKERDILPKKIIIGIDPWLLNKNNGQMRWKSLEYFYNSYNNNKVDFSLAESLSYKYSELFSLSYFQASIKSLPKLFSGMSKPIATQEKYNETNTKLSDGSLVYRADYRNATQNDINSKIERYIAGNIYSIENFETISDEIWTEFQNFISTLRKEHISIEFFLCPYAPIVYDKIAKEYPNVVQSESLIVNFAHDKGIRVHGSFNPYDLRFDETYFYDGMHCKEKGIREILKGQIK